MTCDLTTDCDTKRVTETPSKSEIEKLEDLIPYRNFCRENLEAVMNAAGIPEGLQKKVLKIEGMDTKSCSETLEET